MSEKGVIVNKQGVSTDGTKGGLFVGKRHSEGGIEVDVVGGGKVEVETDEALIKNGSANTSKTVSFDGKQMTPKEVLSKINTAYNGVPIKKKGGEIEPEEDLSKRWDKKITSVKTLSNNIRKLRYNVSNDLKSQDEKTFLTALAIRLMDITAERVGNETSAENGHVGITGLEKNHIKIVDNKIFLNYTGKSGVEHEKTITDTELSEYLKKAIKNSSTNYVFCTSDGFCIKNNKINRYLNKFNISAKDIRGYSANNWIIERLKNVDISNKETQRKRQFNEQAKLVAKKVGHGLATLKTHYLIPEIEYEFIEKAKLINISDLKMSNGGNVQKGDVLKMGVKNYIAQRKSEKEIGKPVVVEGGAIVITRNAVLDNKTKHEFNGKKLTNKEILSEINKMNGGVDFAKGGNVDCGCEHGMEEGGNIDTWIISALASNNEILSEKINHPVTHKEIFDKYKKDGYTIVECQIYKVSNISVIDNYKNALEKYILSKYGQSIKWGKTFIPYEIIGEKIIISDTLVITNIGKEVNVKPKDLFNYYSGGGEIIEPYEENTIAEQKLNELDKGIKIESTEHSETLDKLESGEIDTSEAIREIAETHIEENPNYYKSEDLKLNNMYYIKKEDLGVLDSSPIIVVGTEFYSENGNEKWIVEYFTDKEIKLKHTPKSVLSNELGEKTLTYEQVLELFKNNHLSIKNILNDRELELALSLIKKEISNINYIEKHKVLEAEKEELSKKPPKIIRIVNGIEINDSDISDNKLLK